VNELDDLRCPACGAPLHGSAAEGARCSRCERTFPRLPAAACGVWDLRHGRAQPPATWPAPRAQLEAALAELEAGTSFKSALERLLRDSEDSSAARLMQLLRESRGAWFAFLRRKPGRALLVGNALSGAAVALAAAGWRLTILDPSVLRARLAAWRQEFLVPGRSRLVAGGDGPSLPFSDASFDLLALEDGLPGRGTDRPFGLPEVRRVLRGELAVVASNRLGYKRSILMQGQFEVHAPLAWLGRALSPSGRAHTLRGWRRRLRRRESERVEAFSLYPHSDDFTHVVALDAAEPRLWMGPKERGNRLKVAAHAAGLFPVLTPSFLLLQRHALQDSAPPRWQRLLEALASKLGAPTPRLEHFVATRGNTAVLLTHLDQPSAWCVHVPLSPAQAAQVANHDRTLRLLRRKLPSLPLPEAHFCGEIDGLFVCCESRVGGLAAPQLTGDLRAAQGMFAQVARDFARLAFDPARPWSEADFEELVGARMDRSARFAHVESTVAAIAALRERLKRELVGRAIPVVLGHQDLRSKHLQVERDGRIVGYLDWGTADDRGLVWFDLLHLIVHERKQEQNLTPAAAWRLVRERGELRAHEAAALEHYGRALGLDETVRRAMEAAYPVFVAAMAEATWDYSRPRWLHRQFGI
jgi:aminoglycoside phosphotransferase (APT) family kinase protein